jgi:hypothetical protein
LRDGLWSEKHAPLPQRWKVVFDVCHNLANSEPHMGEIGPDLFPGGAPNHARKIVETRKGGHATMAAEAMLDGEAQALTRKAIDMALAGDTVALKLCLERVK